MTISKRIEIARNLTVATANIKDYKIRNKHNRQMRKLADNLYTGNIINPWHVFNSACGELQGVEKRWNVSCMLSSKVAYQRILKEIGFIAGASCSLIRLIV